MNKEKLNTWSLILLNAFFPLTHHFYVMDLHINFYLYFYLLTQQESFWNVPRLGYILVLYIFLPSNHGKDLSCLSSPLEEKCYEPHLHFPPQHPCA